MNRFWKKGLSLLIVTLLIIGICVGCTDVTQKSGEEKMAEAQKSLVNQANDKLGLPEVKEFYEKAMAKEIIELRDNSKLICYAYTKNEMTGKYVYEGKCMGFGLPYSVQYTNPQVEVYAGGYERGFGSMPQADPNGLYMPSSAAATWLMMINEDTGKREVQYYEPNVIVTQSKKPRRLCEEWSLPKDY